MDFDREITAYREALAAHHKVLAKAKEMGERGRKLWAQADRAQKDTQRRLEELKSAIEQSLQDPAS